MQMIKCRITSLVYMRSVMLKLLSNHDPRFLTHGLGLIRLLPTVMEHESSFSSCCRVPTNKSSVLSSLINNWSWIIQFLTTLMHFSIACIASAWAVSPSSLEPRIQLRIIRETMSIRKIMFHDLKQLGHIHYQKIYISFSNFVINIITLTCNV